MRMPHSHVYIQFIIFTTLFSIPDIYYVLLPIHYTILYTSSYTGVQGLIQSRQERRGDEQESREVNRFIGRTRGDGE